MSMEMYVVSPQRFFSIADWQAAIDQEAYPVRLNASVALDRQRGALPVMLDERPTSFECDHWPIMDVRTAFSRAKIPPAYDTALAFRWGADFFAAAAAYFAAAAYSKVAGGIILDCQEGKAITQTRAVKIAREMLQQAPMMADIARRVIESLKTDRQG